MDIKTCRVKCSECGGERTVQLHKSPVGVRVDWLEDKQQGPTPIISMRERLDGVIGWQCACGNNDLMTAQEARTFSDPAQPKPQEISQIVNNLQVQPSKFDLVEV